jgi:hypothetical protein
MPSVAGDTTRSKGFTVRGALAFVEARYGAEGKAKLLPALDAEARALVERVILSSE